jgi:Domain of unknown function (DUF4440)
MQTDAELLALEKDFWTSGPSFYEEHLAADATMLFPAGLLRREQIVASIGETPRWQRVRIDDPYIAWPLPTVAVLTYQAAASRPGTPAYAAQVTSVYVLNAGGWQLAFHQQLPETAMSRSRARPAARLGASAVGAAALGALATGAMAIGALAVGRLAIGALAINRASVRALTVDDLTIRRVRAPEPQEGG